MKSVKSPGQELEMLFREHQEMVFRTAYRITGSVVDSEDVLQTVFLRLSRRQGEIDLEPSPGGYLHRAAVNASLDLIRQRGRTSSVSIDDVTGSFMAAQGANPEKMRESAELRGLIRQAIAGLGEKSAEMFVLKYFEGCDNREIADRLGTSPMVVGVLLHRARTRVRKEIGDFLEGGRS
ncbi:MAG: sigma-70 family RNA polymerase sigma factor [Acidobacteriota bacterium]|nr:MAG: sigma-70 family RNA polymerase sigma factor [Acidobacteriota bacterium]